MRSITLSSQSVLQRTHSLPSSSSPPKPLKSLPFCLNSRSNDQTLKLSLRNPNLFLSRFILGFQPLLEATSGDGLKAEEEQKEISIHNLDRVRKLKSAMTRLSARVQKLEQRFVKPTYSGMDTQPPIQTSMNSELFHQRLPFMLDFYFH